MYTPSARRRNRAGAPTPIRTHRHNRSIFAGAQAANRSPVPWSPGEPTPPSTQRDGFETFPVSPESARTEEFAQTPTARTPRPERRVIPYTPSSSPVGSLRRESSDGAWESIDGVLVSPARWTPRSPHWSPATGLKSKVVEGEEGEETWEEWQMPQGSVREKATEHGNGRQHCENASHEAWWEYPLVVVFVLAFFLFVPLFNKT